MAGRRSPLSRDYQQRLAPDHREIEDDSTSQLLPQSRIHTRHVANMDKHDEPGIMGSTSFGKKYTYAAFFLLLSLISFVVQTETAVLIQQKMHWKKAYAMLWLTHSSWCLLWPAQLLILRVSHLSIPWATFLQHHVRTIRSIAQTVETQKLHPNHFESLSSPIPYLLRTTALITTALTIAGASWYIAVDMTSPSDLTAIYNCSAFFAYAFSIPLLGDRFRLDKMLAVLLAIVGVLTVAYGDSASPSPSTSSSSGRNDTSIENIRAADEPSNRVLGNIIIGFGSVLYGLYEVLYKKLACPPLGTSPMNGMLFANTAGSLIGTFTFLVLWLPLPFLHFTGLEPFAFPNAKTAAILLISVLANAVFSGSFLVLISLTSPVLSSVAALLTILIVPLVDWIVKGERISAAACLGGLLIVAAFLLLSWSTYREMVSESAAASSSLPKQRDDSDHDNGPR